MASCCLKQKNIFWKPLRDCMCLKDLFGKGRNTNLHGGRRPEPQQDPGGLAGQHGLPGLFCGVWLSPGRLAHWPSPVHTLPFSSGRWGLKWRLYSLQLLQQQQDGISNRDQMLGSQNQANNPTDVLPTGEIWAKEF